MGVVSRDNRSVKKFFMFVKILASGSRGNSIYVESGETRILIDAGISGKKAKEGLAACGRTDPQIDAILVTHDHSDHAQSVGIFHRLFKAPVYVTKPTLHRVQKGKNLGKIAEFRFFDSGQNLSIGRLHIETIPTPHDAEDGVCFVVDNGEKRLGILTDLGHVFAKLEAVIPTLDTAILESNYDEKMLDAGPYPYHLKRRIRSDAGHISNREAADLIRRTGSRLQWICLAHLSQENNTPHKALASFRNINGEKTTVMAATQDGELIGPPSKTFSKSR